MILCVKLYSLQQLYPQHTNKRISVFKNRSIYE